MNIAVCIKQVPAVSQIALEKGTNRMLRSGVPSIVNYCDKNAVEEGLRLRDTHGGCVTVFSMGPEQAEAAVRECIGMGVDHGVLICDKAFEGSDTIVTSLVLARAIKKSGEFDVVLCGMQAIDGDTGQVGPGIAERLGIPQITYVNRLKVAEGVLTAERENRAGVEIMTVSLPALCTITPRAAEPRKPSIKGKMAAKDKVLTVYDCEALGFDPGAVGLSGSVTGVAEIDAPPVLSKGVFVEAPSGNEAAKILFEKLEAAGIW